MKYETIEIQRKNNIVTIILNRPEVHNAMNEKLMKELTSCFEKLNKENQTRIIILTGKGKSFSAGADLNWMKSMANYSREENIQDSKLLSDLYETIYTSPKPIIGYINGHAFGGGIGLIAVCDITIASPDKKFAFSEVNLGIIPSVISTYVGKRIGISNMRRLFITGEIFNSQYAKKIGLIDYIVLESEIDNEIQKNIEKLKTSGPNAIIEIKKLVERYQKMDIGKYKEYTVKKISELRISEEGQEGIKSFLEKRKTKWSD
ncbi:MAG: enoyl-CoA hydratase-related protein [Candidatus Thermoplasmatota archaeon]|nr:enoyl-CoA hydratase-related protein [Candidatus Thermoplasmatota archaeon]